MLSLQSRYRASYQDIVELAFYVWGFREAGASRREAIEKLASLGWCGYDIIKIMQFSRRLMS